MQLLLPQRELVPNYLNFINIVALCGKLQTLLDVVYKENIKPYGPVVEFSLE
jgi:hypothetical protein